MEGDADAVDFLLDVPLDEARALVAPFPSGPLSSRSALPPSNLLHAENLLLAALSCECSDEVRTRIITTLRRAGLTSQITAAAISSDISKELRTLILQPLADFVRRNTRKIFEAVSSGSVNVLHQWLECGVDISSCIAADGKTLLHACVSKNAPELLEVILSTCAPNLVAINIMSSSGASALHLASEANHSTCIRHLLSHSADVNALTDASVDSNTALILAAAHCSNDALLLLLANRADVLVTNRLGLNALHVAAAAGNTFGVQSIIAHASSIILPTPPLSTLISSKSVYGDTPLHLCVLGSRATPLRMLKCALLLLEVI
jgi:ankyrin repeat protein